MRMLNYLLNYFLFGATMFFAAGASAVGEMGGGGGEGGGTSAGSSEIHESGDGSQSSGDGSGDNGEILGESSSQSEGDGKVDEQSTQDPNAQPIKGVPQKFAELYKTDKDFRNLWESAKSLRQTFPGGVKEAVQLAKTIQEFGGLEGIESVKADLDRHTANAELLSKDPAKWIESEFAAQPEAALKSFSHSLDFVAEHHPEHYDHLMSKVIFNDLKDRSPMASVYQFLSNLKDAQGKPVPDAEALAKKISDYWNETRNISAKVPEKKVNEQLDKREQTIKQQEEQVRNKTINSEAGPYMSRSIDSVLATAAKSAGFDLAKVQKEQPNRYARFLKDVNRAVHEEVLHDTKWLDRYDAALKAGDTAKCVRMLNARHDQAIKGDGTKPGVVAPVFHDWFGPPKAAPKRQENQQQQQQQQPNRGGNGKETPMLVNSLPPAKDINYSDPLTDKWNGIYRLKTGKLIQVKRA